MSGPPPNWDSAPPPDQGAYGGGAARSGNGQQRRQQPRMSDAEVKFAAQSFYAWLAQKDTMAQLRLMLPDHVDPDIFIATCKTAVLNRPQLLREDLRSSLMVAVMKAAGQGLKPDGKEGALVTRYDSETRSYVVVWQPMVWGITKLGRETGAIKSIRAVIVYNDEPFEIIQGEEDIINHRVDINIEEAAFTALHDGADQWGNPKANPDAYFEHVRAAYCFMTGTDGTVTKRWMTRKRLMTLKDSAKAKNGPWNSVFIDEMIRKAVILFTSKWINLDTESAPAKRFHAALLTDLEVDFDRQGQIAAPERQQSVPALEAPAPKLDTLEAMMTKKREAVPVGAVDREAPIPTAASRSPSGAEGGGEPTTSPPPDEQALQDDGEPSAQGDPLMDKVADLVGILHRSTPAQIDAERRQPRYARLIKELNDAGRFDLVKRIDKVAEERGA